MTYELTITQKPGYLHAVVSGENTRESVVRYLEEVIRECTLRQCFRVLIEERLEGPRFSTLEIFEVVSTGATRFLGAVTAMAYVDVNAQSEEMLRFAENVAVNRASPVKIFSTVAAAERWLRADASRSVTRGERADAHKPRR